MVSTYLHARCPVCAMPWDQHPRAIECYRYRHSEVVKDAMAQAVAEEILKTRKAENGQNGAVLQ